MVGRGRQSSNSRTDLRSFNTSSRAVRRPLRVAWLRRQTSFALSLILMGLFVADASAQTSCLCIQTIELAPAPLNQRSSDDRNDTRLNAPPRTTDTPLPENEPSQQGPEASTASRDIELPTVPASPNRPILSLRDRANQAAEELSDNVLRGASRALGQRESDPQISGIRIRPAVPAVDLKANRFVIRLTIGGGTPAIWRGQVEVTGGDLVGHQSLGMQIDEAVAMRIEDRKLLIEPLIPRPFDAVDLVWEDATPESQLVISLAGPAAANAPQAFRISLAELLSGPGQWPLDDSGNRVQVARAPGDAIPIRFRRDHLVFEPGEVFEFEAAPHAILDTAEAYQLELRVVHSRTEQEALPPQVLPDVRDLRDSGAGLPLSITMPTEQGAYSIRLDVVTRRSPNPFVRPKVVASRTLDVIVASSNPAAQRWQEPAARSTIVPNIPLSLPRRLIPGAREEQGDWSVLHAIEPGTNQWTERLRQLDAMNLVKRFHQEPMGLAPMRFERIEGQTWMRLEPGEWYAFPLPIQSLQTPHRIDVQTSLSGVESELERILGVSVLEPDARTWERIPQADVGFALRPPHTTGNAAQWLGSPTTQSSLHFWPQSRSPWVVVSNLSKSQPMLVGKIELLSGPQQLSPAPTDSIDPQRLAAAYFRRPSLDTPFQPTRLAEGSDIDWLEDWTYFDRGLDRLIQHLKASGLNAVAINVASDGGAWYPSQVLQAGTRWDRGRFSDLGRDPLPKDLVELMLRKFDAAGLKVIPVFDFNSPIPAIENVRRVEHEYDVDQWSDENSTLRQQRLSLGQAEGFYDPSHPDVANVLVEAINEFVTRYESHASFAGVAVRVGPGSHLFYGGANWGLSRSNLEQFASDLQLPMTPSANEVQQGDMRSQWLAWRAASMTDLLGRMQRSVTQQNTTNTRQFFVIGEDWYQGMNVLRRLHPSPRGRELDSTAAALEIGISINDVRQMESTVLVQSMGIQPRDNPSVRRLEQVLWSGRVGRSASLVPSHDQEIVRTSVIQELDAPMDPEATDRTISVLAAPSGLLVQRQPKVVPLDRFLPVVSAGAQDGAGMIRPVIVDQAIASRRALIEGMVEGDVVLLMDEAWSMPTGIDQATREFLTTMKELPTLDFLTLNLPGSETSPVLVRAAVKGDRIWVYFVNPSPWPLESKLKVRSVSDPGIDRLGVSQLTADRTLDEEGQPDGGIEIVATLPPFGIAAFTASASMKLEQIETPVAEATMALIQQELDTLLTRVNEMGIDTASRVTVDNADFEQEGSGNVVPTWLISSSGTQVRSVDDAFDGNRVLAMTNDGAVAWARSRVILPPRSGRLSIKVLVRAVDGRAPQSLRLSVEAQTPEGSYYQFAQIGAGADGTGPAITGEWTPFAVHFDDLPCDSISELRVGFDLMSEGSVEIDSLEVLDGWFDEGDKRVLFQRISVARLQLQDGNAFGPYRLLESYWPRVILSSQPKTGASPETNPAAAPRTAAAPETEQPESPEPEAPAAPRNLLERVRDFVPAPRARR